MIRRYVVKMLRFAGMLLKEMFMTVRKVLGGSAWAAKQISERIQIIGSDGKRATNVRGLVPCVNRKAKEASAPSQTDSAELIEVEQYLANLPSCKPWLRDNPRAKALVERGLQEASVGRGVYLGSFAKYADLEIEDD